VEILAGIFRYGIRFCFTIMIDSRFGTACCEPGPNPHGEIEDVAFNGALRFVATFCVHSGLGSESLSNPGNPGFRRQTIL
jgi:hypothetical protein